MGRDITLQVYIPDKNRAEDLKEVIELTTNTEGIYFRNNGDNSVREFLKGNNKGLLFLRGKQGVRIVTRDEGANSGGDFLGDWEEGIIIDLTRTNISDNGVRYIQHKENERYRADGYTVLGDVGRGHVSTLSRYEMPMVRDIETSISVIISVSGFGTAVVVTAMPEVVDKDTNLQDTGEEEQAIPFTTTVKGAYGTIYYKSSKRELYIDKGTRVYYPTEELLEGSMTQQDTYRRNMERIEFIKRFDNVDEYDGFFVINRRIYMRSPSAAAELLSVIQRNGYQYFGIPNNIKEAKQVYNSENNVPDNHFKGLYYKTRAKSLF